MIGWEEFDARADEIEAAGIPVAREPVVIRGDLVGEVEEDGEEMLGVSNPPFCTINGGDTPSVTGPLQPLLLAGLGDSVLAAFSDACFA